MSESATPASAGSTVAGATGAATVQTVRVVLPLITEQRLEAMRKGLQVERQGLVIQVPIDSQALEGVDADGEGVLKRSTNINVNLDYTSFVLQGKTVDEAYADYQKRFEEFTKKKEEERRRLAEMKGAIKQAIIQRFPNVTVSEGRDVLYASYTSGNTNDSVTISLSYAPTVEQTLRYLADLIQSVEELRKRSEKWSKKRSRRRSARGESK